MVEPFRRNRLLLGALAPAMVLVAVMLLLMSLIHTTLTSPPPALGLRRNTALASGLANRANMTSDFGELDGPLSAQRVQELGVQLQALRARRGHWTGGAFDAEIDGFNGGKHRLMVALGRELGRPGTPAVRVVGTLGEPDDRGTPGGLAPLMPGPAMPDGSRASFVDTQDAENAHDAEDAQDGASAWLSQQGRPLLVLVYEWRGKHDMLWFAVDAETETVVRSGWWSALE
ncbi:hypothetical protein HK105_204098 [Polyrhizophydium stewartii]|uniref:Uncharacterized protein n=1 Tax=Polyrhizophydium stewartii TaxID=2732419 RepID=A0ABR4N9Z6_9FUNG